MSEEADAEEPRSDESDGAVDGASDGAVDGAVDGGGEEGGGEEELPSQGVTIQIDDDENNFFESSLPAEPFPDTDDEFDSLHRSVHPSLQSLPQISDAMARSLQSLPGYAPSSQSLPPFRSDVTDTLQSLPVLGTETSGALPVLGEDDVEEVCRYVTPVVFTPVAFVSQPVHHNLMVIKPEKRMQVSPQHYPASSSNDPASSSADPAPRCTPPPRDDGMPVREPRIQQPAPLAGDAGGPPSRVSGPAQPLREATVLPPPPSIPPPPPSAACMMARCRGGTDRGGTPSSSQAAGGSWEGLQTSGGLPSSSQAAGGSFPGFQSQWESRSRGATLESRACWEDAGESAGGPRDNRMQPNWNAADHRQQPRPVHGQAFADYGRFPADHHYNVPSASWSGCGMGSDPSGPGLPPAWRDERGSRLDWGPDGAPGSEPWCEPGHGGLGDPGSGSGAAARGWALEPPAQPREPPSSDHGGYPTHSFDGVHGSDFGREQRTLLTRDSRLPSDCNLVRPRAPGLGRAAPPPVDAAATVDHHEFGYGQACGSATRACAGRGPHQARYQERSSRKPMGDRYPATPGLGQTPLPPSGAGRAFHQGHGESEFGQVGSGAGSYGIGPPRREAPGYSGFGGYGRQAPAAASGSGACWPPDATDSATEFNDWDASGWPEDPGPPGRLSGCGPPWPPEPPELMDEPPQMECHASRQWWPPGRPPPAPTPSHPSVTPPPGSWGPPTVSQHHVGVQGMGGQAETPHLIRLELGRNPGGSRTAAAFAKSHSQASVQSGRTEFATTLMINNIPIDATQKAMIDLLDRSGFEGLYDYFYMPCNFGSGTNQGHAFVNLRTAQDSEMFINVWAGMRLLGVHGEAPVLKISPSAVQGYETNARMWTAARLRRIKNPAFRPFLIGPTPASGSAGSAAGANAMDAGNAAAQGQA